MGIKLLKRLQGENIKAVNRLVTLLLLHQLASVLVCLVSYGLKQIQCIMYVLYGQLCCVSRPSRSVSRNIVYLCPCVA